MIGDAPNGSQPSVDSGSLPMAGGAGDMQPMMDAGQDGSTPLTDAQIADAGPRDSGMKDTGPVELDAAVDTDAQQPDACTDLPDAGGCACDSPNSDGDEAVDCLDECPDDALKIAAGVCGCGVSETDSDNDETPDCMDGCANDPNQTAPGPCGCNPADGDDDGVGDCIDGCPQDGSKSAPGICGCGQPDIDDGSVVSCSGIVNALAHRYRFDGTGATAADSVGTADADVMNATLADTGTLELAGGSSDDFLDLPNSLFSGLTSASFEIWLTWAGGGAWQRIFDFGSTTSAEGSQGTGETYLFLTPQTPSTGGGPFLRAAFTTAGSANEDRIDAPPLASGTRVHLVLVVDEAAHTMTLYLDGASVGTVALSGSLSGITYENNWIGRSQFSSDPELGATIDELRIYNAALTAGQVQLSFSSGPDPAFLEPAD